MANKGKRFELDLKNQINEITSPHVKAHRPDFSGSSTGEVADIMVLWEAERYGDQSPCGHPERFVVYGELKKRSADAGNRVTVMRGSSDGQTGLGELRELRYESPPWTDCVVAVKFNNRELVVLDAALLEHWLRRDEPGWGEEYYDGEWPTEGEMHGARLTPSNNVSMVKPELDWWPSSQSGESDAVKFLHGIGVENYDILNDYRE